MDIFRSIVFAAALAGLAAGLLTTVLQQFSTIPLILEAEAYETQASEAARTSGPTSAGHAHDHAAHDQGAWAPEDGFERTAFTAIANIVTGIGFALLLVALYAMRGRSIGWYEGLLWGLAGFAVFTIAPSLGLPPELPGMPAAPLGPRQAWWIMTAAMTAAGIGLLAFRASPLAAVTAIALIVFPHLVGAPQPAQTDTLVPHDLAHSFIVAATVTSFLFWVVLGVLAALLFERFTAERHELAPLAG